MAELVTVPARVSPVNDTQPEIRTYTAAVAIVAGQGVYLNSSGKAALAVSTALATSDPFLGVALNAAAAGAPVAVLSNGGVEGMGVSGLAYGTAIYVSETTAGDFTTTAPSTSTDVVIPVGRVLAMSGPGLEKVLWFACDMALLRVLHG